jgi:hypothetical protein
MAAGALFAGSVSAGAGIRRLCDTVTADRTRPSLERFPTPHEEPIADRYRMIVEHT